VKVIWASSWGRLARRDLTLRSVSRVSRFIFIAFPIEFYLVAQKLIFNSDAGHAGEFEICFVPTSNERLTTPSFGLSSEQLLNKATPNDPRLCPTPHVFRAAHYEVGQESDHQRELLVPMTAVSIAAITTPLPIRRIKYIALLGTPV
jgi:hypothetical protein